MKKITLLILSLAFFSCTYDQDNENIPFSESNQEITSKTTNNYLSPPLGFDINIQLFKTPRRDSTSCSTGFGFCVTIVIILFEEPTNPILRYDPVSGDVSLIGTLIEEDKYELRFPMEILDSPYHDLSDFDWFEIPEDVDNGDVKFLEGSYPLSINYEEEELVYVIDVSLN